MNKIEYQKVYYRINSSYKWGHGMDNADHEKFEEEVRDLIKKIGLTEQKKTIRCESITGKNDFESLYFHPMDFSGYIQREKISIIERIINEGGYKTFSLRGVDTYETVIDWTDEELEELLNKDREEIGIKIIESLKTKRKNLFRGFRSDLLATEYAKKHQTVKDRVVGKFIYNVFEGLIEEGKIEVSNSTKIGKAYRATQSYYDNKSKNISDWTDQYLKKQYKELDDLINNIDCFNANDILMQELICDELRKRRIKI